MKPRAPTTKPQASKAIPANAPSPIMAGSSHVTKSRSVDVKPPSSIQADVLIDGNVTSNSDLHLDGTIRGDVKVANIIVGESGNVEGKIEAETIEVRGRVIGSIQGREVKLLATAYVEGDILHDKLSIDVGAFFQGRCQQNRHGAPSAAPFASATFHNSEPVNKVVAPSVAPVAAVAKPFVPSLDAYDVNALSDLK